MSDANGLKVDSCVVLNELADEIAERYRRGERPCLQEYLDRHPELADDLRDLLPAVIEMERVKKDQKAADAGPSPPLSVVPEQLGDYRLLREIGRGGMGVVYEAEQVSLGRHVALKVLSSRLSDSEKQRRRFEREAKSAAKLHHTNIVPVFGVGEHEGVPYYVMQFIHGQGLDAVLAVMMRPPGDGQSVVTVSLPAPQADETLAAASDPPPPTRPGSLQPGDRAHWREVARIGVQVADALDYAHRQTVLHRDIKPSNLLLDAAGTIWVTDFGLAKAADQPDLTDTGDLLGTLRYMPPEAFEGRSDARGDVYSLGLTLYELLALRPAFGENERLLLIKQVTEAEPPRLHRLNPAIPRDLVTIVHKAIERDPAHRYATAGAMAADLQRFLDDEPIRARRVSLAERLGRWARRNRAVAAALSVIGLLLLVLASGALVAAEHFRHGREEQRKLAHEKDTERGKAVAARDDAEAGRAREAGLRKDAERREAEQRRDRYFAEMNLAGQALDFPGGMRRVSALVSDWRGADLRHWEWYYLNALCHRDLRTLSGHGDAVQAVAWSPDGKSVASAGVDGTLRLWQAASGREVRLIKSHGGMVMSVSWSPDGTRLASVGDRDVKLWDPATGKLLATLPGQGVWAAWSPDGKRLLMSGAGLVRVWDFEAQTVILRKSIPGGMVGPAAWSPDGKRIAAATSPQMVRVWDVVTGREQLAVDNRPGTLHLVAWSPDGRLLAVGQNDGSIRLLETTKGRDHRAPLRGHLRHITSLAWRPDGKRLLSTGRDATIKVWDPASGQEVLRLRGHAGPVRHGAWSPDGKRLVTASSDGTVKIWDAESGPEVIAREFRGPANALAWSPDSQRLASAHPGGLVTVWPAAGGAPHVLRGHTSNVHGIAWSPDGKRLASCCGDYLVKVRDPVSGKELLSWRAHDHAIHSIAWSPNGKWLATGSRDQSAKVWDADKGALQRTLGAPDRNVWAVAWDPDSERLAAARGNGRIVVWAAATGKELHSLEGPGAARAVVWSPDGKRLASAGSGGVGGERRENARSGSSDLTLWNSLTGEQVQTLRGHFDEVTAVSWSPDGKRLATGSHDGTVKVWDPLTGREVLTLRGHKEAVRAVAWSPDGKKIATAGGDKVIRIHDATKGY